MKIIDVPQGSPEWFSARLGLPTASNFSQIVTAKGDSSKQREKYLYKLAGEIVSGEATETYQSAAMERGIIMEEEARAMYALITGENVTQVGFCIADNGKYGCSPDGLVGDSGGLEIKCPLAHTHVSYLLKNKLPVEYLQQVQGSMLVTGRKWWDFMSYYPGIRPLILRIERDEDFIESLENELEAFCGQLAEVVKKIQ